MRSTGFGCMGLEGHRSVSQVGLLGLCARNQAWGLDLMGCRCGVKVVWIHRRPVGGGGQSVPKQEMVFPLSP